MQGAFCALRSPERETGSNSGPGLGLVGNERVGVVTAGVVGTRVYVSRQVRALHGIELFGEVDSAHEIDRALGSISLRHARFVKNRSDLLVRASRTTIRNRSPR